MIVVVGVDTFTFAVCTGPAFGLRDTGLATCRLTSNEDSEWFLVRLLRGIHAICCRLLGRNRKTVVTVFIDHIQNPS